MLRLYSAYGPWEEPDRLVPTLLGKALAGELPPLVSPRVARDFVHVDDVCEVFVTLRVRAHRPLYNVGSGRQTTIAEIVEAVERSPASRRSRGGAGCPTAAGTPRRGFRTRHGSARAGLGGADRTGRRPRLNARVAQDAGAAGALRRVLGRCGSGRVLHSLEDTLRGTGTPLAWRLRRMDAVRVARVGLDPLAAHQACAAPREDANLEPGPGSLPGSDRA